VDVVEHDDELLLAEHSKSGAPPRTSHGFRRSAKSEDSREPLRTSSGPRRRRQRVDAVANFRSVEVAHTGSPRSTSVGQNVPSP
jgi:hypothetical protein